MALIVVPLRKTRLLCDLKRRHHILLGLPMALYSECPEPALHMHAVQQCCDQDAGYETGVRLRSEFRQVMECRSLLRI